MTATIHRFEVPGSGQSIEYARDEASGRLLAIEAKGRRYLTLGNDGIAVWEDGWLRVNEFRSEGGFTRRVEAAGERWCEHYRWGDDDRIAHVDGVDLRRDERGRIVACLPGGAEPAPDGHRWLYAYAGDRLVAIEGPEDLRHLSVDADGRVTGWRSGGESRRLEYTREGHRRDASALPPQTHHRDAAGRLWTLTDPAGRVLATYLWDGFRCLARVDGALGEPVAAVFSLDPSATPVRVCTPTGARRIARDAFGEGLLAQRGVPGLFGGAVHRGFVHLPWRVLDPASGSFCAPDPFDGSEDDPRRGPDAAYTGELPVEHEGFGSYAVCRHDPVGRGDPSGAISAGLVISGLTWSLQNNLLSFFAMDWWANMIGSLVTGCYFGDALDTEGLVSSERLGAFGLRRDGVIATERAFTTQHIVWCENESFEKLLSGRVVDPRGEFEPTLYGSLLLCRPSDEIPFVLRGMASPGGVDDDHRATGWTRAGGAARPAVPGARAPRFPSGGLHLDTTSPTRRIVDCPVTELAPGDGVALGDFEVRATIDVRDTSRAPAVGDTLLLFDGDDDLMITQVVSAARDSGRALLRLEDDAPSVGPDGVTLRKLDGAAATSESREAVAGLAEAFAATAGGTAYATGDLLKLSASAGGDVTVGRVERLEVRLPLDRALPASLGSAIQVIATSVASAAVKPRRRSGDTLEFASGTPPSAGDFALLRGNGSELPVRVVESVNASTVRVDADVSALGAADAEIDYHAVTSGAGIGRRSAAAETESRVTYTPNASGNAPDGSAGSLVLRFDGDGNPVVRRVTGAPTWDAVVLDRAPAGTAPWTVERYRVASDNVDLTGLSITTAASIVARPASLLENADALMLQRLEGAPATSSGVPSLPQLDLAGQTGSATLPAPSTASSDPEVPRPGQVVVLRDASSREEALVQRVRLAVTFDRDLDVQERDLQAVRLTSTGPEWIAHRLADRRVVLEAFARTGATAAVDVEFPRLAAGETVRVTWVDGATASGLYRVTSANGTTLDLAGEPAIPAGAGDIRLERLVPGDPGTGGVLLARDGERVGASPTRKLSFSVWKPNDLPRTRLVGIVSGDTVIPALVDNVDQDLEVTFAAAPSLTSPITLDVPNVLRTRYAARFVREGDALLVSDDTGGLDSTDPHTLVVVPFVATDRAAASARLHPGSLRIPADEEAPEVDRKQSLVDHELAHTLQYARFGPIWFNIFPMLALELPAEFSSNTELPEYSEFQSASVTAEGTGWRLAFSGASIELSSGDVVQIVKGGNFGRAEVDSVEGGNILLKRDDDNGPPPTGAVQVRRRNANDHWDRTFNVFGVLTHGGLMNLTVGNTYGGLLWLLSKGVYGIYRAIAGTGELYDAQVRSGEGENAGRELELSGDGARRAIQNGNRILVRQGESSVVRTVASRAENVATLDQRVSFTGAVKVAPYSAHDPGSAFDWLDYHPATIPDLGNPAVIELAATGGDSLELSPRDRVEILYRDGGKRNNVVSVAGNTIQLENGIRVENGEASLRIAKIDSTDPMGNADSAGLVEMGMGWMQWLFDPWGQLQLDLQPQAQWLNITTRIIRYAFGTQMWSLIPFGYLWWERLFPIKAEHLSIIEQEASEESGDLYSPLGRLTGQASGSDDFARYDMVAGDVARYRYWLLDSDNGTVIEPDRQDAPGVHFTNDPDDDDIRIIPHRADRGGSGVLNEAVQADASSTSVGRSVPDLFTAKPTTDPNQLDTNVTDPVSFQPGPLGFVPTDPTTERCIASYVAFCEPGDHRVTVRDGIFGAQRGRDTQDAERQPLFFELSVSDVEVRVAGQVIPRQPTVQRIELVQTQEVTLSVSPNAGRQYRVTVQRPADGPTLRAPGNLRLQARTTDGTERVEISRFYAHDGASGSYANGGLSRFGLHLGGDVHLGVRQLDVEVVSTLPLRASAEPSAGAATSLAQGSTGFLLVPAAIVTPPRLQSFDGRAPAGGDPAVTLSRVASPSQAAAGFVGSGGGVFEVSFASSPAVTGTVPIQLEVTVGTPGDQTAVLTCAFDLTA